MTKKEKREMIAAAMKAISEQTGLSPAARRRGLEILRKAHDKNNPAK